MNHYLFFVIQSASDPETAVCVCNPLIMSYLFPNWSFFNVDKVNVYYKKEEISIQQTGYGFKDSVMWYLILCLSFNAFTVNIKACLHGYLPFCLLFKRWAGQE